MDKADALDALAVAMLLTRDGMLASSATKQDLQEPLDDLVGNRTIEGIIRDLQWDINAQSTSELPTEKLVVHDDQESVVGASCSNIAQVVPL